MIPDKLFFPEDGLPRYIDWDGSPIRTKQVEDSDICYIRKAALLEWANDSLLECEASNDDTDYGRIDAYKNLIEKLNSM